MSLKADIHQAMEQAARRRTTAKVDDLTREALAGINAALEDWLGPTAALAWWRQWAQRIQEQAREHEA